MKKYNELLNPYYIRDSLSLESKLLVPTLQVYNKVDSTNNILLEKNCIYPNGHTCLAEKQTMGRGMLNKSWLSVRKNVCFSTAWSFDENMKNFHLLNFLIAAKIISSLKNLKYSKIQAKWPNDIIYNDAKLAGILIDVIFKKNSKVYVVVGVGINIEVDNNDKKIIDQKITSLSEITNHKLSRNTIAAALISAVVESLSIFKNYDFKKLSEEWNKIDYNYNKHKKLLINGIKIDNAKLLGINEKGQLRCLQNEIVNYYNINEVKIIND